MISGVDVIHSFGIQGWVVKWTQSLDGSWNNCFFKKACMFYGHVVNSVGWSMVYAYSRRVVKLSLIKGSKFGYNEYK